MVGWRDGGVGDKRGIVRWVMKEREGVLAYMYNNLSTVQVKKTNVF